MRRPVSGDGPALHSRSIPAMTRRVQAGTAHTSAPSTATARMRSCLHVDRGGYMARRHPRGAPSGPVDEESRGGGSKSQPRRPGAQVRHIAEPTRRADTSRSRRYSARDASTSSSDSCFSDARPRTCSKVNISTIRGASKSVNRGARRSPKLYPQRSTIVAPPAPPPPPCPGSSST